MRTLRVLALALTLGTAASAVAAQDPYVPTATDPWSAEELENLLAPIALYPDPILAQVLVAATYPDQIVRAAAYVRQHGTEGIDYQPWEISVKAVAHYPPVLNLMAEGQDWTIALGQAYALQSQDVMAAVQSLRRMARAQGNLQTTAQQRVVVEREVIQIVPAQPRIIYVPTYDPAVIFFRPIYVVHAHPAYWSWGLGYPIGAWLTYDFDWWSHRVYYHGWFGGPAWVVAARPWVVINPIYVAPRHTTIVINRNIIRRNFDPHPLRRHSVVHRHVTFDRRGFPGRRDATPEPRSGRELAGELRRAAPAPTRAAVSEARRSPAPVIASRPTTGRSGGTTSPVRGTVDRVRPIAGAPTRRPPTAADASPARGAAERVRHAAPVPQPTTSTREVVRSAAGTWNPRPARPEGAASTPPIGARAGAANGPAPRRVMGDAPPMPVRSAPSRSDTPSTPRASAPRLPSAPAASSRSPVRPEGVPRAAAPQRSSAPTRSAAPPARSSGASSAPSRPSVRETVSGRSGGERPSRSRPD